MKKQLHVAAVLALVSGTGHALEFDPLRLLPDAVFVQAGFAENSTGSYVVGVGWNWNWRHETRFGTITGFHETSFGRWITRRAGDEGSAWATQAGITPVLRLQPASRGGQWFVEAGVGLNMILPLYRSDDKRFSTEFNFGDHAAIGRYFGSGQRREVALRVQHFSNAGLDHPNPGENFLQLRYALRF
ncbi:MAG: acyloxyacyl hydrolase [Steroidobacteraceae bacterium]